MGYVKVTKNNTYYKRYQVKYRRRREGKTDYYARRRMVAQDLTKFSTPKYRFIVRVTNKDVVCQFVTSTVKGDLVHVAAYSHELPRFGIKLGLTNYAAVYATGLLAGRRLLKKFGMDSKFAGTEATGAYYLCTDAVDGRRPFKAFLDIGLVRTTTGARVFAGLKGAVDAGVNIPHSESRFPGWNREEKKLNVDVLRKYIFGGHVAAYMEEIADDDAVFEKQFSRYIKEGIKAGDLEGLYKSAHAKIRANPDAVLTKKSEAKPKSYRVAKRTYVQRKDRVRQILAARGAAMGGADAEDDE